VQKYSKARHATDYSIIRHMCFAYRISKATETHSEYVILIAFPLQPQLHEGASLSRLYLQCLFCILIAVSLR